MKNCFRCGSEFEAAAGQRVCVSCRITSPRAPTLSFRERQVVALVLQAKANKEIAWELHLAVGTIKEYMFHIFRKLEVGNRTELALWAFAHGEELEEPNAA